MIYGYVVILALYLLLFFLSRKESVGIYRKTEGKNTYPGEIFFLKAAIWCIRQKERCLGHPDKYMMKKENGHQSAYEKELFVKSQLGKKLRLLHPEIAEKHQVREFYIRQYALALTVFFVGNLLSLCVAVSVKNDRLLQEGSYINRKAYGEGNTEVSLTAQIEGEEAVEEVQYTVEAQKYDAEEVKWLFQEAVMRLPEVILGENKGLDDVVCDLELIDAIEGYPFQITWESSCYAIIRTDGSVHNEDLEAAEAVTLKACFRYEEEEYEEVFPVLVQPMVYTEKELLMQRIKTSLEEQNRASETESTMFLPDHIGTKNIIWKEVMQDSSGYFFLFMCVAAVFVFFTMKKEVEEKLEKRNRELLLDYPELVNKITLYMGAGMSIRNAFLKMGEDYKKQKVSGNRRYVYEEILLLCHELQSGISELEVYAHLGKRCQLQPYLKLSALLTQNIRKGSNDLLAMLRQETTAAFEQRKNNAKKAGEEAGTKLLLPMMMMLCIVMVLIMIPAYFSFT